MKYAIMKKEHEKIVLFYEESIQIARDSIEAVHAYENWIHALPL